MERTKWTEEALDTMLTTPSDALAADMAKLNGDIMVLGAGGKMGPTLCVLAKRAMVKAGVDKKVIAVSRGSDARARRYMEENGVETISCDLLDTEKLRALPDTENVIYMAGRKFGTDGNEWQTWSMNAALPAYTAEKFKHSRIVVFSSGNIYPLVPVTSGGCREEDRVGPVGEYAMSCLARERVFEYAANTWGTRVFFYRLNYAVDLRYGVLYDIARNILEEKPVSLRTACFNCIWQGSANEIAIRGLLHADSPACTMNVTGPEILSVRQTALELGRYLGKEPIFEGEVGTDALLNNSAKAMSVFGYPAVSAKTLIRWQAEWLLDGGRTLDKPTHFEQRDGKF